MFRSKKRSRVSVRSWTEKRMTSRKRHFLWSAISKKPAKKPVVRLACLSEIDGALVANCVFLDRPDTEKGMNRSEIAGALKASGVEIPWKDRERMQSDPSKFTPYLPEVVRETYASAIYGTADIRHGFFRLGRSEKPPKILLYRIEVWQNGVLAAKSDSSRTGLGTYDIPADWHEWKKYPQKFRYAAIR